jgi:peptide-methionine (R)-S-oxide reductase
MACAGEEPRVYSKMGYDITPLTMAEREAAAVKLTTHQRYVALQGGTEQSFTGETVNGYRHDCKEDGVYVSAVGELPLFDSRTKFESGTGWPSFWSPIDPQHVIERRDTNIPFLPRVEVLDARSGAHLGHVFKDGAELLPLGVLMVTTAVHSTY